MNVLRTLIVAAAVAIAAMSAAPSQASTLIGDRISCTQSSASSSFECSPFESTVGGGREFSIGVDNEFFIGLNFTGNGVNVTNLSGSVFTLANTVIELRNLSAQFSEARLQSSSILGFTRADIALSNGTLSLDFRNTVWAPNSRSSIQLQTIPAVPEPATWAFLMLGLGAIGGIMRLERYRSGNFKLGHLKLAA